MKPLKLAELAEKLACRLEGDPAAEVTGVAGMDHAAPGHVSFLANRRYFLSSAPRVPRPSSSKTVSALSANLASLRWPPFVPPILI